MSRSEWVCTLPPWRRLLAMLNWRPVYDIEQRTRQLRIESLESEKRTKQLESEFEQRELERDKRLKLLKSEIEVRKENERSPRSNPEWMPCCSVPIPPRRHLPQPAPTE